MNSRERVRLALNHKQGDRVPLDLGGTAVTGMQASMVYKLRQALGLDAPGTPVKVTEPFQMLGEIGLDLIDALGADCVPLAGKGTFFGFKNEGWKPWTLFDGTPVLVPAGFNTKPDEDGAILLYPEGDKSAPPSGKMPKNGYYFDPLIRQEPIDEEKLSVEDQVEEFAPFSDEELNELTCEAERLYNETDKALVVSLGGQGASLGDIAFIPAPMLKRPKGIRDFQEWYLSTMTRRDFLLKVFDRQSDIALESIKRLYEAVGDKVAAVFLIGTDFGMQHNPFISNETYRELYMPYSMKLTSWIHKNTKWKTFMHSCGAVLPLIEDFIATGFDILNPVQCSATGMDPRELKQRFGDRLTFWGGAVNTQHTLPYGTPDQVRREVRERIEIFGRDGGFVCNAIHNIQAKVPIENVLAFFEAHREYGHY